MGKPKRLKVALLTFTAALGSGLVMQYGDAVASRWGVDQPITGPGTRTVEQSVPLTPVSASAASPSLRSFTGTPAPRVTRVNLTQAQVDEDSPSLDLDTQFDTLVSVTPVSVPNADTAIDPEAAEATLAVVEEMVEPQSPDMTTPPLLAESDACEVSFQAVAAPLATVILDLDARCHADMPVVIHHQGMMFHAITDEIGSAVIEVPALSQEAFFIAAFDDGEGAVAITGVPELAKYDRAVLQWQGRSGVQLHAREFDAPYGSEGHIWSEAVGSTAAAMAGTGGHLTTLGNASVPEALMAEVYTFPTGQVSNDGSVNLSVEAEVTAANCGRDVSAQSIQIAPGMAPTAIDLSMTMPDCDSVGEFLVLNNMFEDLTLAAK